MDSFFGFMNWHPAVRAMTIFAIAFGGYLTALSIAAFTSHSCTADLAVVFGTAVTVDGQPSRRLEARLEEAAHLQRQKVVPTIFVSGGKEADTNQDEADVMTAYLLAHGVSNSAIVIDHEGNNTMDTARHAVAALPPGGSALVVTQWFHVPRAVLAMKRAGARRVCASWPFFAEARDIPSLVREAIAWPYYVFRPVEN